MNNFKGGGFKKGGNKFGNKPKFGGEKKFRGGGHQGAGDRDRSPKMGGSSESHSATCSSCKEKCEVPFRPSADKPVYCSNCFGKKLRDEAPEKAFGREDRGLEQGRNSTRNENKAPRSERSPRHDAFRGQGVEDIAAIKRQLEALEVKLNKILDVVSPPMPSSKIPLPESTGPKKERNGKRVKKGKRQAVAAQAVTPEVKKSPAKKVATKKVSAKKVAVKKAVKKVAKKSVTKKVPAKKVAVKKVVKKVAVKKTAKKVVKK